MMRNKRLMAEVSSSKKYIAQNVIFQWIKLLANTVIIFQIGILIEKVLLAQTQVSIAQTLIICCIMMLIRFASEILANRMAFKSIAQVKQSLRARLYDKLLRLGAAYNHHVPTSEVVQIAGEGIEQLETYVGRYMPQLYYSLLAPMTLFVIIGSFSMKTALILLLAVPLIPMSIIAFNKIAKKIMKKYWGQYTKLGDDFLDNLQGLTTLKIYDADQMKHEKMNVNAELFRKATMRLLTMQLNSIVLMNLIAFGGTAMAIIMAITSYSQGEIALYQGFIIIMLGAEFFIPLRLLGSYFHVAMNGTTACDKLFKILEIEEPHIATTDKNAQMTTDVIYMKAIDFKYDETLPILKQFNMRLPHQSFTGLVGQSGCGKSTIASLIMGFIKPNSGDLYIEGTAIGALTSSEVMQTVTLITHDAFIFKGTIRENLLLGKPSATDADLFEVLDSVALKAFVLAEGGLDYALTEQGSNLSGGQKQRLAIARALLHNSSVYIFDEATSNIDVESENAIMNVVHELAKVKTVLLISHRLANVVEADQIYVFEKSGKYDFGTHRELLEHSSTYRELYQQQMTLEHYGRSEKSIAS